MTRPKLATYGDLPDRHFTLLFCRNCGAEYSAHRGDYFQRLDERPMCCEEPLLLVRKVTRYIRVRL